MAITSSAFDALPEELIAKVCESLTLDDPNRATSLYQLHGNSACMRNTSALRNLCLVSKKLARCAQPCLVASAAPVLARSETFRSKAHEWQRPVSCSAALLLIRTLLLRKDLRPRLRCVSLDLSGEPAEHADSKGLTVGYLKRLFGKEATKIVLSAFRDAEFTSRKTYFAFQSQRFPEKLVLDMLELSARHPQQEAFTRAEMATLIRHIFGLTDEQELDRSLTSRLLRSSFEDDRIGVNIILATLVTKPKDLALMAGSYGTRFAGCLLRPHEQHSSFSILSRTLSTLRHVSITNSNSQDNAICLESFFLQLPGLASIEIDASSTADSLDVSALEKLEEKSNVSSVLIRGRVDMDYLTTLLKCFKRLEHFEFAHQPQQMFGEHLHESSEEPLGETILKLLEKHRSTLISLRYHCSKWCAQCNMDADFSMHTNLKTVDVDARCLGFPSAYNGKTSSASVISSRLPSSLEKLGLSFVPCFGACGIQETLVRRVQDFVDVVKGERVNSEKDGSMPEHRLLPQLNGIRLDRIYYDWYCPFHQHPLGEPEISKWKGLWVQNIPGVEKTSQKCQELGVSLEVNEYMPVMSGVGPKKTF